VKGSHALRRAARCGDDGGGGAGGALLLAGADGQLAPAPTLETDADLSVSGAIVRAR
jgi:hypothetical protein